MNPTFQLVHVETGMTLGQYKVSHKLRVYTSTGQEFADYDFVEDKLFPMLRGDGAIGFQRRLTGYDEAELFFLPREEWRIEWKRKP